MLQRALDASREREQTLADGRDRLAHELASAQVLLRHYTDQRQVYVREHAPVILGGLMQRFNGMHLDQLREWARAQAGLLWDETTGEKP